LLQKVPLAEELWKEICCVEEMNFRFRSVGNPISTVSSLSHAMQDNLPIQQVLSGPAKMWDFDPKEMAQVAGFLSCSRLRVLLANKAFTENEHCPETERWYGTRFGAGPLPDDWHGCWERRRVEGDEAAVPFAKELGLALPMPNPFVAENLDIMPKPENGVPTYPQRVLPLPSEVSSALAGRTSTPDNVLQVYFRQDDTFELPKACLASKYIALGHSRARSTD